MNLSKYHTSHLLLFIIASRALSEILTTFFWSKANYVWSAMFLVTFPLFIWPYFVIFTRRTGNLFLEHYPIIFFLFYLFIRTDFGNVYAIKCLFSDFIVWTYFIFTIEICKRDARSLEKMRKYIILLAKVVILLGAFQLGVFLLTSDTGGDSNLVVNARPVHGIFDHPSTYLICVFPYFLYFIKNHTYGWIILTFATIVATGTRGPFLASICLFLPYLKLILNKPITGKDLALSFITVVIVYSLLIVNNSNIIEYSDYTSRFNFASLQWRISYWREFIQFESIQSVLFGHGVGAADLFLNTSKDSTQPSILPHNDYLRLYWDIGVVGLTLYLNLIVFIVRLLYRSTNRKNSYVLIAYLVVICFGITDNLIYLTYPIFIFTFIAAFIQIKPKTLHTGA